jgi:hypothetical protein
VRNVTERKMGNKHLLEACKDKHITREEREKCRKERCVVSIY